MGNESSALVDESTPPQTLEARTIEAVAKYIRERDVRRIVVMVGSVRLVPLLDIYIHTSPCMDMI